MLLSSLSRTRAYTADQMTVYLLTVNCTISLFWPYISEFKLHSLGITAHYIKASTTVEVYPLVPPAGAAKKVGYPVRLPRVPRGGIPPMSVKPRSHRTRGVALWPCILLDARRRGRCEFLLSLTLVWFDASNALTRVNGAWRQTCTVTLPALKRN